MLKTHPLAYGDIRLRPHPFLIHEAAKNEAASATWALDFDRVK
jgi:hypothetical protein